MRSLGCAQIWHNWYPYEKKKKKSTLGHRQVQTEDNVKMVIYKPRREASEETNPTNTLILDF